MTILNTKALIHGLKQRLFYIKNLNKRFSPVFFIPGSLREKIQENYFFKVITKKNKTINLTKDSEGYTHVTAGKFKFKFPKRCFYEGDFFDIVYPSLNQNDRVIKTFVYDNPYYESEGEYEHEGAVLNNGDYVIDAGANIGMFSVVASDKIGSDGKVFAFEPLEEICVFLDENIKQNNCENISIEKNILGDSEKDVEFFYNLESNFNASSTKFKKDNDKVITLKQITLDNFVETRGINRIDFIKADIEGAERELLKGAAETIKKFKPKIAIRTYHLPDDPEVLYNLLRSYVPEYNLVHYKKTLYAWI